MRLFFKVLIAIGFFASPAFAQLDEKEVQKCVCDGMLLERHLPGGGRVDCISDDYAIEVDPTGKWAEAIGQSLYYAAQTGKTPKIILFCKKDMDVCLKHRLRFQQVKSEFDLPIVLELHDATSLGTMCPKLQS